jgi:hypothetical protein
MFQAQGPKKGGKFWTCCLFIMSGMKGSWKGLSHNLSKSAP